MQPGGAAQALGVEVDDSIAYIGGVELEKLKMGTEPSLQQLSAELAERPLKLTLLRRVG